MRPFSNGMLAWISALISILVAVAGVASKITKLTVSHEMLRRSLKNTIETQEHRIRRLEDAHINGHKKSEPKPPRTPQ